MPDPDYSLAAHPYIPPAVNPLETLQGIEKYRILQHQDQTTGLEAQQKGIDVDSLAKYKQTGNNDDLRGASPELRTGAVAGEKSEQENKKDVMSRDANYILGEQDPKLKQHFWDVKKNDYVKKGWITQDFADKYPTPNDGVMQSMVRGNQSVEQHGQMSGETAGNVAGAQAPYQVHTLQPGERAVYPAVGPGGVQENAPPSKATAVPGVTPPPFSGASPGAGNPAPTATPSTGSRPSLVQPPPGSPASKGPPGTVNAVPVDKTPAPYADEVPTVPVGHDMPTGKGVVQPGIDPVRQAARAAGVKKFDEDIEPAATAAAHTRASLGTMKAELDKGVTTDRLGEMKTSIAAGLYALTGDTDFVKKATGLTTANQEVFNKESTRMGLTFARQTEGAREAVQAIKIALGANPSLLNTEQGNRKIIDIMDQSSKYDQERAKAAQAYLQKNDGHLVGFDTWFNQNHSPATFISKAVPYALPKDHSELQNGVTYEFPFTKDANGKPVMHRGTYQDGHMLPVQQ